MHSVHSTRSCFNTRLEPLFTAACLPQAENMPTSTRSQIHICEHVKPISIPLLDSTQSTFHLTFNVCVGNLASHVYHSSLRSLKCVRLQKRISSTDRTPHLAVPSVHDQGEKLYEWHLGRICPAAAAAAYLALSWTLLARM